MQYGKTAVALFAALTAAAIAASPAQAASKQSKAKAQPAKVSVQKTYRSRPYGFGTGAVIRGHLPGSGVRFGYGYDRFDADFAAYTQGYRGGYVDAHSQYCAQRFRSYDPDSGTYVTSKGIRRSCP
jgi:hypothetical protein